MTAILDDAVRCYLCACGFLLLPWAITRAVEALSLLVIRYTDSH